VNLRGREQASNTKNMAIFQEFSRPLRTNANAYRAEREGFEPTVRDFRLRCARLVRPKMPPHANSVAILKEIDPKAVFSN
jgi:hypothetical protein